MLSCRVSCSTLSSCLAASHQPLGLPANSSNPFTINTYKNCISNSFRMNTYRKTPGRGEPHTHVCPPHFCSFLHSFAARGNSTLFFSSLCALFARTTGVYPRRSQNGIRPSPPICPLPMLPKRAKIPVPLYPEHTVRGAKGACRPGFLL